LVDPSKVSEHINSSLVSKNRKVWGSSEEVLLVFGAERSTGFWWETVMKHPSVL
jgi:hypothetical protein